MRATLIGLVSKARDLVQAGNERLQITRELLGHDLGSAIVNLLKSGELTIPEKTLSQEVRKLIEREAGVEGYDLLCRPDGIRLKINLRRMGGRLAYTLVAKVVALTIDAHSQKLGVHLVEERLAGLNLRGRIYSLLARLGRSSLFRRVTAATGLDQWVCFDPQSRIATADLAFVEWIQKLKTPLQRMPLAPIDLLNIRRAEHVDGGIKLFVTLNLF